MRSILNRLIKEKTGSYKEMFARDYLTRDYEQEFRDFLIELGMTPRQIADEVAKAEPYIKLDGDNIVYNNELIPITCKNLSSQILPF